jgi:hypothetical protein
MVCNQLLLGLACHSSDGFPPVGVFGLRIMPDRFSSGLLAALNDSVEVRESDWNSIAAVLRGPINPPDTRRQETTYAVASENRFAATISSGMARVREGR